MRRNSDGRARMVRLTQRCVAALAMVGLTVAAVLAAVPVDQADRSNPVTVCAMFGMAAAVTGWAGNWAVRVLGVVGGVAAVTGLVAYFTSQSWAPWTFALAAVTSGVTLALLLFGGQNTTARS